MTRDVGELVNLLTVGIHHAMVYFPDHPRVRESADAFARRVAADGEGDAGGAGFFLGVVDGRLVHDGRVLLGPTLTAKRLLDAASRLRCGGFRFRSGVTSDEMTAFLATCGSPRNAAANHDEAGALLRRQGIASIDASPLYGTPGWFGGDRRAVAPEEVQALARAIPDYQHLLEVVELAHSNSGAGREIDVSDPRGTVEHVLPNLLDRPADLLRLARYPDYDSYTVGHSVRVALFAVLAGRHLGLPQPMLIELGTAGLLHDVGKGRIPDSILFKQGPLDDEERRVMKTHPALGVEALLSTGDAPPLAVAAAFGHHLRHDRKGYPDLAPWGRRSRVTALVQVCDVFEALTAVRPYKPSFTPRRALAIMLEDRGAYDPTAFAAFVAAVGFYPPGSRVRLTTGEEAIVVRAGAHPARPFVETLTGADGARLARADRRPLDLGAAGAPRVEEFVEEDLLATVADPDPEAPPASAHDLIEASGACCLTEPPGDGGAAH